MLGDVGLSSGWQGDNSGATAPGPEQRLRRRAGREAGGWIPNHGSRHGPYRQRDRSGDRSRLVLNSNPLPYKPATLDTTKATLETHTSETIDGKVSGDTDRSRAATGRGRAAARTIRFRERRIRHRSASKGGSIHPCCTRWSSPRRIPTCSESGLRRFATWRRSSASARQGQRRDRQSRWRRQISWIISRGRSQSGRFLRAFLHLGFNQDEAGRQVHDGAWPIIAARPPAVECPLWHARRGDDALRPRERRAGVVGVVARSGSRAAGGRHSRSMHVDQDLSEDRRNDGRDRSLGAEPERQLGGDER